MAVEFTYSLSDARVYSTGGMTDVLYAVDFFINATDGTYSENAKLNITFPAPDPATFKPFSTLTQDEVLEWVIANIGDTEGDALSGPEELEAIKHGLASMIAEKPRPGSSPSSPTGKLLPWEQPTPEPPAWESEEPAV